MMKSRKRWLAIGVLALLLPVFSVAKPADKHKGGDWGGGGCGGGDNRYNAKKDCRSVPDGGSAAGYLLAVGATCLGAMFVSSRFGKPRLS